MEFQQLVVEERQRIYSFAYYSLKNREDAEDVTQEVLIRLWRHWRRLDRSGVKAWLLRVARNACCDVVRRRRVNATRVVDTEGDVVLDRVACERADPQADAEAADFQQRLTAALRQLPEPYRSALILRELQDLKYDEIAAILEKPLNTIKVYLHRGRKMLREELKEVEIHAQASRQRAATS